MVELGALSARQHLTVVFVKESQQCKDLICKIVRSPLPSPLAPLVLAPILVVVKFKVTGQARPECFTFMRIIQFDRPLQIPAIQMRLILERRPHLALQVEWEHIDKVLQSIAPKVSHVIDMSKLCRQVPESDGSTTVRTLVTGEKGDVGEGVCTDFLILLAANNDREAVYCRYEGTLCTTEAMKLSW